MFLSNLLFHISSYHPSQFCVALGNEFLKRVLDIQGDQLFELIRVLVPPEVRILQYLFIWLFLHRDGIVSLCVEGVPVVSPELDVQGVGEVLVDNPCDVLSVFFDFLLR